MSRLCPVCGSDDTGGYPKQHKQYTDRGRLDVDDWVCHACQARWEIWEYRREGTMENHSIRLKDGRTWIPDGGAQAAAPQCPYCQARTVEFIQSDGRWARGGANVQRYTCTACRTIWQWIIDDEGKTLFKRLWKHGPQTP